MKTDCTERASAVSSVEQIVHENYAAERPFVSVVLPAFNEAAIIRSTLTSVCRHMKSLENRYRWELIVVNDGSVDQTGEIAEEFASSQNEVRVVHHSINVGLGQALMSSFNASRGSYIVVMDADLSYSPDHIEPLLERIRLSKAAIVVASPYAKGGRVSQVPVSRRLMSLCANRYLSRMAGINLSTFTGMVRVYDGPFIRAMSLRSRGQDISPEIIYKAMLLRGRIEEIPGHLDWGIQRTAGCGRLSSMKVLPHGLSTLLAGFLFRPYIFFLLPGLLLMAGALSTVALIVVDCYTAYQGLSQYEWIPVRASLAVGLAYRSFPHTFVLGGVFTILTVQLIGLALLSMQNKRHFEDLFPLTSTVERLDGETGDCKNRVTRGRLNEVPETSENVFRNKTGVKKADI